VNRETERDRERVGEREMEREKGKEESYPLVESEIDSKIFGVSPLYLESLDYRFSRPGFP
jgi:hypothetical protein